MSFARYPHYRASMASWLGEIPDHWGANRLARISRSGMGQTILKEMLDSVGTPDAVPVYSASETEGEFGFLVAPAVLLGTGDIVVGARGSIGKARRISGPSTCTQTTIWVRPDQAVIDANFLYWYMVGEKESLFPFDKTAIPMLTVEQVRAAPVPLPDLDEQRQVSSFLDRETAKIDALVEEQRRLIDLLKEKRQAVISDAVTKGLDPSVPMKDSGVEWLGEVPAHWNVRPLSSLCREGTSITYGIIQAGPHVEGGVPYIRTGDMSGESLPLSGYQRTSHEIDAGYDRSKVRAGDLVIAIRATIGKPLEVPEELDGANLTQGTARFAPGVECTSKFIRYCLLSKGATGEFERLSKGATFKEITLEALRKFRVPCPPLDEQKQLVVRTDQECARLDALLQAAELAIDLLRERRSAVISCAVTGKIDVRDFVPATSKGETV